MALPFGGFFLGLALKAVAGALANQAVTQTVGRVVPEVVNVGRRAGAKAAGDPTTFVPVQNEIKTLKGQRTLILAVILAALTGADLYGVWAVPDWILETVISLMTGTLSLKAAK
jgi:hypothetical protein